MDFPIHIPFAHTLGLQLVRMANGEAELQCPQADQHLNSFKVSHGGVVMTLLDVAMAHAARSTLAADIAAATGAVTLEMKTSFLRPGEGTLRCVATVLHRTATLAFCEARVLMEGDVLAAHGTGTFKFIRAVPGRGRSPLPVQQGG